jgi:hypothetical protein
MSNMLQSHRNNRTFHIDDNSEFYWLGMRDNYRTLIGVEESVNVVINSSHQNNLLVLGDDTDA